MKDTDLETLHVDVETSLERILELPSKQETMLHGIACFYENKKSTNPRTNLDEMFIHLEMNSLFTKINHAQSEFDRQRSRSPELIVAKDKNPMDG